VTDTDNVTDVDTDTDIDTDVNVQPGAISTLLSKTGNWIMTVGYPALVKNLTIMIVMNSAQKLLQMWQSTDEQDLQKLQPAQSTGLGLLINYMLNENNPVAQRWTTFADFVQQAQPDVTSQQMLLTTIVTTQNAAADSAASSWNWPASAESALVGQMVQYDSPATEYEAYQLLAGFTYDSEPLPVKVGCDVSLDYLSQIA
jgi:hypothetical protein